MAGLVPAIHVFTTVQYCQDVDARHKAGHDVERPCATPLTYFFIVFARNSYVRFQARSEASWRNEARSSQEKPCGAPS